MTHQEILAGASGATVAAAGTFYMLHILYNLQYVYLAGRMNVANLPDNFRQVSDSLSWSVLNFRAPWETAKSNSVGNYQATHGFPTTPQGISTGSFGPRGSDLFSVSGRNRPLLLAPDQYGMQGHRQQLQTRLLDLRIHSLTFQGGSQRLLKICSCQECMHY